ncbi:MAG TPA: ribonuclease T [Gammaproteobacteria bacterium]|nr:ribonuclease T [Gammaproteobacteria bacterium]
MSTDTSKPTPMSRRFRGFMPVVVDVETGGFNARQDALLEVAAATLKMDDNGIIDIDEQICRHIVPFEGSNMEPKSMEVNGIDPYHPFRMAIAEPQALGEIFTFIRSSLKKNQCKRAIMVGHNTAMDLGFINAAAERCKINRNPFHPFSTFDTVSFSGLAYGQTVLSRAVQAAGIDWDSDQAHSASYDTLKTAELFCNIVNRWRRSNGMVWTTQIDE